MESPDVPPPEQKHDWLRRLAPAFYRGFNTIHWQMTLEGRMTGWLKPAFHARFRELLLHTMARHDLICPIYCLMPDHMHLLWMGIAEESEQKAATKFFRQHVNELLDHTLEGARFQKQPYDHVLRQNERGPDAVRSLAWYLQQNPVRAKLVSHENEWSYLGCMIPGYPALHPLEKGYWDKFWRIRAALAGRRKSE